MLAKCDGHVLTLTSDRLMSGEDIIAEMNRLYATHDFKHAIWDMRVSGLSGLDSGTMRRLGRESAEFAEKRGVGARTGFIVNSEADVAVIDAANLWSAASGPIRVRAFTDINKLRQWLEIGDEGWRESGFTP